MLSMARSQRVELTGWDVAGRRVARLFQGEMPAGEQRFEWRGDGSAGSHAAPGLYFLTLRCRDRSEVRRVVLLP